MLLTLAAGFAWLGYYNHRVTGSAFTLPYVEHYRQYCMFPIFLWQQPRPRLEYRHFELLVLHAGWEMAYYNGHFDNPGDLRRMLAFKAHSVWASYLGWAFTVPLVLGLPWALKGRRQRWTWLALAVCLLVLAALLCTVAALDHYAAPALGMLTLLQVQSLRGLDRLRFGGWHTGRIVALGLIVWLMLPLAPMLTTAAPAPLADWLDRRQQVEAHVLQTPGKHLIVVRYGPAHDVMHEWVRNTAELSEQEVLWAREMDTASSNRALIDCYSDRRPWLVEPDANPIRLRPYPVGEEPPTKPRVVERGQ